MMNFFESEMGTYGWVNNEILIAGGWRAGGFHKAGHLNSSFIVCDEEHRKRTGQYLEVGRLTLTIRLTETEGEAPKIVNLIKLEIHKEQQRKGYGRKVVEACAELSPGELRICDIKKSKLGFWKKMGIQNVQARGSIDGIIYRQDKQLTVPAEPEFPVISL